MDKNSEKEKQEKNKSPIWPTTVNKNVIISTKNTLALELITNK